MSFAFFFVFSGDISLTQWCMHSTSLIDRSIVSYSGIPKMERFVLVVVYV